MYRCIDVDIQMYRYIYTHRDRQRVLWEPWKKASPVVPLESLQNGKNDARMIEFTLKPTSTVDRDFNCAAWQAAASELFWWKIAENTAAALRAKISLVAPWHATQLKSLYSVPVGLSVNSIIRHRFCRFGETQAVPLEKLFFKVPIRCADTRIYVYVCLWTSLEASQDILGAGHDRYRQNSQNPALF